MMVHKLKIKRWTWRQKRRVYDAIAEGRLDITKACEDYGLSLDEIAEWSRKFEAAGKVGLHTILGPGRKQS